MQTAECVATLPLLSTSSQKGKVLKMQARLSDLERQAAQQQCIIAVLEQRIRRLEGIGGPPVNTVDVLHPLMGLASCTIDPSDPEGDECQKKTIVSKQVYTDII